MLSPTKLHKNSDITQKISPGENSLQNACGKQAANVMILRTIYIDI